MREQSKLYGENRLNNRRSNRLSKLVLVLVGLAAVPGLAAERSITILHTNDMHGRHVPFHVAPGSATAQTGDPGREPAHFDRFGDVGGFAYLAGAVNAVRERDGADRVLLFDGGDTFSDDLVGNETRGEAMISLMNALGYQFMSLGNHDFDYGLERTRELEGLADFPMRGANTIENGKPIFGEPYEIFDAAGIDVAVLALAYHNTSQTGSKANVEGLTFTNGIEVAREWVPKLRERADLVVVLSHQGTAVDRLLAREVPDIDLIIGGHSHDRVSPPEDIDGVWMVQALSDAAVLGEIKLVLDTNNRLQSVEGAAHNLWNDEITPDAEIAALVAQIDAPYRERLDEVLATAYDRISRQYKSESPFDALVGEMMRTHTGAEVAFMPGVGYGVSIKPGPITREDLYTLVPHPTKLVTLEMQGARLLGVLEQSATNLNPADDLERVGGLVQTSGIGWTLDLNAPVGQRVSAVTVNGEPLQPERWYKVAANAGLVNGLHRYDFSGRDLKRHSESVTDVVESGLKARAGVVAPQTGNIRLIPVVR